MKKETELFFSHVMTDDYSILDFLTSDYSWVNERLVRHYGIRDVHGSEFRRVSLVGTHRGGVVSQGSVLALMLNPARTSPVKRGKWVMGNPFGHSAAATEGGRPSAARGKAGGPSRHGSPAARAASGRSGVGGLPQSDGSARLRHGEFRPSRSLADKRRYVSHRFVGNLAGRQKISRNRRLAGGVVNGKEGSVLSLPGRKDVNLCTRTGAGRLRRRGDRSGSPRACAKDNYRFSSLMIAIVESAAPFQQRRGK